MGIPCDDVVQIRPPEAAGEPTVIAINCPDKIGLGCDLCRVILVFGLNIVRGDASTDGKWCYVVFWVVGRGGKLTRWGLLKKRLLGVCPSVLQQYQYWPQEMMVMDQRTQVFLLKFCCFDRNGLLHDVTEVLCELELTILKVKVSTTPDGRVMDLFFITDTRELLHTRKRKEETCDKLKSILGDSMTSCELEPMSGEITACLQASPFLPPEISEEMFNLELPQVETDGSHYKSYVPTVTVDNSLSPGHSLIQILCQDHKGLLYDIMRTLKDYNIQLSYGRFYTTQKGRCEIDLFVVQMDGKKILDNSKQKALCDRLRMEMYKPLRVTVVNRGPDTELFVANPVELSGRGRPLVFHDITLALKMLHTRIFLSYSGSAQSSEKGGVDLQEEKSEVYSSNMTQAMGAVLTYRHELGMNYNFIRPDLIVGSCLQTPSDVDKLIKIGVKTIFCLQQNSDLEYFGVEIQAIEDYAKKCENIEHVRAEIRDFDAFDLRMRLPAVVSKLHKAINLNGGVTYIHCTAGLGRAPSVALAYMYWVLGYKLSEAHKFLQSRRACCPKLEAVRSATADVLTGLPSGRVILSWKGGKYSVVEVSGLDIGWGQRIPLKFNPSESVWLLERDLPEGHYEYKYIVDGEWTCNTSELMTSPQGDGHVNNYIHVSSSDSDNESKALRKRLIAEDDLTLVERQMIREFLEQ